MNLKGSFFSIFLFSYLFLGGFLLGMEQNGLADSSQDLFSSQEIYGDRDPLLRVQQDIHQAALVSYSASYIKKKKKQRDPAFLPPIDKKPFYFCPMKGGSALNTCVAFEGESLEEGFSQIFISYTESPTSLFKDLLKNGSSLKQGQKPLFKKLKKALLAQVKARERQIKSTQKSLKNCISEEYEKMNPSFERGLTLLRNCETNLKDIKFPDFFKMPLVGGVFKIIDPFLNLKVIVTGHHYGGTLCQCVAFLTGEKALTFESPSPESLLRDVFSTSFFLENPLPILNCQSSHPTSQESSDRSPLFCQTLFYEPSGEIPQDFWTFYAPLYIKNSLTRSHKTFLLERPEFLEIFLHRIHPTETFVGKICSYEKMGRILGSNFSGSFKEFSLKSFRQGKYREVFENLAGEGNEAAMLFRAMGHFYGDSQEFSDHNEALSILQDLRSRGNPIALCQCALLLENSEEKSLEGSRKGGSPENPETKILREQFLQKGLGGCLGYALDLTHPFSFLAQRCIVSLVLRGLIQEEGNSFVSEVMENANQHKRMDPILERFFLMEDLTKEDEGEKEKEKDSRMQPSLRVFQQLEKTKQDPVITHLAEEMKKREEEGSVKEIPQARGLLLQQVVREYPDHVLYGTGYDLLVMQDGEGSSKEKNPEKKEKDIDKEKEKDTALSVEAIDLDSKNSSSETQLSDGSSNQEPDPSHRSETNPSQTKESFSYKKVVWRVALAGGGASILSGSLEGMGVVSAERLSLPTFIFLYCYGPQILGWIHPSQTND